MISLSVQCLVAECNFGFMVMSIDTPCAAKVTSSYNNVDQ